MKRKGVSRSSARFNNMEIFKKIIVLCRNLLSRKRNLALLLIFFCIIWAIVGAIGSHSSNTNYSQINRNATHDNETNSSSQKTDKNSTAGNSTKPDKNTNTGNSTKTDKNSNTGNPKKTDKNSNAVNSTKSDKSDAVKCREARKNAIDAYNKGIKVRNDVYNLTKDLIQIYQDN